MSPKTLRRFAIAALACAGFAGLTLAADRGSDPAALRDGCTSGNCSDPTNSFTAQTLVLLADGSTVSIADVQVGDLIAAVDPATGVSSAQPVVGTITGTGSKRLVHLTVGDATLTATANHRFWVSTRAEWVAAGQLTIGDRIGGGAGGDLLVTGVSTVEQPATVYNLDVAGPQTFQVVLGGQAALVHE
jgi:hypothetical protein